MRKMIADAEEMEKNPLKDQQVAKLEEQQQKEKEERERRRALAMGKNVEEEDDKDKKKKKRKRRKRKLGKNSKSGLMSHAYLYQ